MAGVHVPSQIRLVCKVGLVQHACTLVFVMPMTHPVIHHECPSGSVPVGIGRDRKGVYCCSKIDCLCQSRWSGAVQSSRRVWSSIAEAGIHVSWLVLPR